MEPSNDLRKSPEFIEFVRQMLTFANVKPEGQEPFLAEAGLNELAKAFTHKSVDPTGNFNYELLEFLGDSVIKSAMCFHLKRRFPKIISEHWLTAMKQRLESTDGLSKIVMENGFAKFARFVPPTTNELAKEPDFYPKMYEDVFEAFIGAIQVVARQKYGTGVAYEITENLINHFLNKIPISEMLTNVFNPISRFKELAEKYHWAPFGQLVKSSVAADENGLKIYTWEVYAYSLGDQTYDRAEPAKNRELVAVAQGTHTDAVKAEATKKATEFLIANRGIVEKHADPTKSKVYRRPTPKGVQ